jgi:photosystem II stability/assembly factor-like uncharacterized protein
MKTTIFCICILMTSPFTFSQWVRTSGPEGISIGSLLTVGNTIYAGTETDGVYSSTNDGVNWFPMNSGIETQGIGGIAAKPGYLFAGTRGNGVYHSTDGGQTWLPPSNENNLYITSMAVKDSYIFAISHGTYRSSDNGVTWVNVDYSPTLYYAICVDGNKIFTADGQNCYVSTDDGLTWTTINGLVGGGEYSLYCSGNLVIASGANKIFRSLNQGVTFTPIPISFGFGAVNINTFAAIGSTLFLGNTYDGVYKSTDIGLTWTPVNTGIGPKNISASTVTQSSTLIAGAHYAGVFRSTNSGSSWNRSMSGFPAGSTISGLFASKAIILAGTYDGVFRSNDNGFTWNKLTGNNDTINYSHVRGIYMTGDTIFMGTIFHFHSTVYRSNDNGATWEWKGSGLSPTLTFLNAITKSGNKLLAGAGNGIYYSTNNGDNWIFANGLNTYVQYLTKGGGYVYASTDYDVYRSADDGVNWTSAISGFDFAGIGAKDNYACVGTFESRAVISTNNGALWFPVGGIPGGYSVFGVSYVPQSTMVLASTYYQGNGGIYASYNDGLSFSPFDDGLRVNTLPEFFATNDTFMFAGTDYQGVWRRIRPEFVNVANQHQDVPQTYSLGQNYPNPFNPETKIKFDIPSNVKSKSNVKLFIYNILGKEVASLVDKELGPGSYEIRWDASNYPSGVYYYRLVTEGYSETKKMVLVK